MAQADPKNVTRRIMEEAFNKGKLQVIDELVAKSFVGHDPAVPEPIKGPEGLKAMVGGYRAAFPDLKITVMDQIEEGPWVATRWRAAGRQDGELWGISPTGKRVTITGIAFERVEKGKLVETWDNWDALGLLRQLGVVAETVAV